MAGCVFSERRGDILGRVGNSKTIFKLLIFLFFCSFYSHAEWKVVPHKWEKGGSVTRIENTENPDLAQVLMVSIDPDNLKQKVLVFAVGFLNSRIMCSSTSKMPDNIRVGEYDISVFSVCESVGGRSFAVFQPRNKIDNEKLITLFRKSKQVMIGIDEMYAEVSAIGFTKEWLLRFPEKKKEMYRSPLYDIDFSKYKAPPPSKEQQFYWKLKKSSDTCAGKKEGNSAYRCFVEAFPKKCEHLAQGVFSSRSYKERQKHFNCVSTCVDASWFDTKFGECSRTEYK